MIDQNTSLPIRVLTDVIAGPYIRLPYDQIKEVRQILDRHRIPYRVEENIISMNGGPYIAVVNLGRKADAKAIQELLDSGR